MKNKNILVFDLETDDLDINTCNIISFHGYSYREDKYYNLMFKDNKKEIQKILDSHQVYVTYNGDEFDTKIISRVYAKQYNYVKPIDLLKIIKRRGTLIKYGGFKKKSLSVIAKALDLKNKKIDDFDYDMLKKPNHSSEEIQLIFKYGQQDIEVTKELFEYLYNYFYFYREYMNKIDIREWSWLMSSPGTYAYKAICHLTGLKEEWLNDEDREKYKQEDLNFEGGYVSIPATEFITGNIYCLDFNSAYPHAYIMLNLFGNKCTCCTKEEKYDGGELFELSGKYCTKQLNIISKVIKDLYMLRLEYKKNKDPREVALKIILNTLYGICGNPVFKNVFNINTAKDCTLFVRESIKLGRKMFTEAGYKVLYSDTDSIYMEDVYDDEERLMMIKTSVINKIKKSVPFQQDTFDMGIDDEIRLMYFPGLKKKNYLYVTKTGKLKLKGLPLMKSNASKLGVLVFNKYIKKEIIDNNNVKFKWRYIKDVIDEEIGNNFSIVEQEFNLKELNKYNCKTNLFYNLAEKYGKGQHNLIPNTVFGTGKSKKFCTLKEFNENKLCIRDIVLDKFWQEINPFIKTRNKQKELSTWTNIQ